MALLSHALNEAGLFAALGAGDGYIHTFTRTATPLFVVMFGFMAAHVYGRRLATLGLGAVWARLLRRSAQCYACYALTSLAALLGDEYGVRHFLRSLVLLSDAHFGNILSVYALLLPVLPVFLLVGRRRGWPGLYLLLVLLLLSMPLLAGLDHVDFGPLTRPLSIVFGIGTRLGGPSAWHALAFVLAGMLAATSVEAPAGTRRRQYARVTLLLLCTVAVLWVPTMEDAPRTVWRHFVDATYREQNHIGYYLIGIATSLASFSVCVVAIRSADATRPLRWLLPVGRSSLFAYTFGNAFLSLFDRWLPTLGPVGFLLAFFAATVVASHAFDRWSKRPQGGPLRPPDRPTLELPQGA